MIAHAVEPFDNQGVHEGRLLVQQRVPGAIEDRKSSARVVLDQLPRPFVPRRGILATGKNQHGMGIGFRSFRAAP